MDDSLIDLNDAAEGVCCGGVLESSVSGSASKVGATRTKQRMKTMFSANRGWKLAVILSSTPARGGNPFGFVWSTDTTPTAAGIRRGPKNPLNRWDHIKAEVSKFSGYMAEMIRSNPSGMSDADKSVCN
ncbi:unnamed protein product [Urochloa decumbens]|uniref:Uncharacterized protein n=1 Tax=Urochloa decumbens TaxID=240449 RepID=A0ABC9CHS5_9POAL